MAGNRSGTLNALFLGNVAADTHAGIRDELPGDLAAVVFADPGELRRNPDAAAQADILVSNHWHADYPGAPNVRLVQSVATGIDLFDLAALPHGAAVCNSFGHESAIAEYVIMTWLALHHRLFEISGEFRDRGSWRTSWVQSGAPHGEVRGSTLGIVGYGRVGREVARRAAPFGTRIVAANRTPREPDPGVDRVYPLDELDAMLAECDTVALCTALGPETTGLIDARRLALMRPGAFLINIARGQVIDEDALYGALRDGRIGGAAIDVWWQYPTAAEPNRRGSHHPFHELPNVIVTPHNSGWTQGMVRRRWDEIAENIRRFALGESLINLVVTT
jgi:phosphoglycerate dehydrogenase-like enzyme